MGGDASKCRRGYTGNRYEKPNLPPLHLRVRSWPACLFEKLSFCACRCGMCEPWYYQLSGECVDCGDIAVVRLLSRAVPCLLALTWTAFLYWGGTQSVCPDLD